MKERVARSGVRNSLIIAIAPTATIASIVGCYEAIEPMVSNLFKRETLSGEFMQINKYLVNELKNLGMWTEDIKNEIKIAEGSIQNIPQIPAALKELFRTVWEVPMKALIDMAADRGAYIDQSQSLNLFIESPTIGKLSSMYMYSWKKGIKTTYYLRSRPATSIAKTTTLKRSTMTNASLAEHSKMDATGGLNPAMEDSDMTVPSMAIPLMATAVVMTAAPMSEIPTMSSYSDAEVIACSIDNPEACEACQ